MCHQRPPIRFLSTLSALLTLCLVTRPASGDIYRFVTVDGIETFTDAPVSKDAKVVIREKGVGRKKTSKGRSPEKTHDISLNEIAEKTVIASLGAETTGTGAVVEPRLPPVGGTITSPVGMRIDPIDGKWRHHNGIDIAIPQGTPVTPAAPGVVVYSGQRPGYGNTVLVEHANGMITLYGHNSLLLVSAGQVVDTGTTLALSGNTGRSTGPHLHFEAWQSGINVTPSFMPGSTTPLPTVAAASTRHKSRFRRENMADGSVLFTNLP